MNTGIPGDTTTMMETTTWTTMSDGAPTEMFGGGNLSTIISNNNNNNASLGIGFGSDVDKGVTTSVPSEGGSGADESTQKDVAASTPNIFELCRYRKEIKYEHNLVASIICVSFIFFGVVYLFFGYRCFKAILFLTGFVFGTVIVYYICSQDTVLPQYAIIGVSIGAGILFGLITLLMQPVGLFLSGFQTGLLLCLVSMAATDAFDYYKVDSLWTTTGALMGFALLFALLTITFKKSMSILGSSLFGSAMIAASMDYFVENLVMVKWVWEKATLRRTINPCWYSWILLTTWPALLLVGLIIQCAITGRGVYHEKSLISKKTRPNPNNLRPRNREQRAEMKQKKYRYLYQVRTAHGDVISQNYVQALQQKVIPGNMTNVGETSTLQSDATHLTTLPVDQTTTQLSFSECNTVDSGVGVNFDAGYQNVDGSKNSMKSY